MQRILFLENEMREDARGHTSILVRRGHLDPIQLTRLNPISGEDSEHTSILSGEDTPQLILVKRG
jgi:hypothetical protein